jgi:hypothetical protein
VFTDLLDPPQLDLADLQPELILDRRLSKKGNASITQVLVRWSSLPANLATWEDYNVIKTKFPDATTWGQAATQGGGNVVHVGSTRT